MFRGTLDITEFLKMDKIIRFLLIHMLLCISKISKYDFCKTHHQVALEYQIFYNS